MINNIHNMNARKNNDSLQEKILSFLKNTGYGFYVILIITIIHSIIQIPHLAFEPAYILNDYKLWTLVTFVFVNYGFLNFLIGGIILYFFSSKIEKEKGSVFFFHRIFLLSLFLSSFHFLLYIIRFRFFNLNLFGVWPIFLTDLSINCFQDPLRESGLFFVPFKIKQVYIPFAIVFINILFNGSIIFSDISCIIIAIIIWRVPAFISKLELNNHSVERLERLFCFKQVLGTFFSFTPSKNNNIFESLSFKQQIKSTWSSFCNLFVKQKSKEEVKNFWIEKYAKERKEDNLENFEIEKNDKDKNDPFFQLTTDINIKRKQNMEVVLVSPVNEEIDVNKYFNFITEDAIENSSNVNLKEIKSDQNPKNNDDDLIIIDFKQNKINQNV